MINAPPSKMRKPARSGDRLATQLTSLRITTRNGAGANRIPLAVYPSCKHNKPSGTDDLSSIIESITAGDHADTVALVRAEADPKRRAEIKKRLPCVQFSASEAREGREVLAHSGLLQIDLDHIGHDVAARLRDETRRDPHIAAAFVSPSGDGLKLIMAITARVEGHGGAFEAARRYVRETYGHEADPACRDVKRLCFASHDPDAWHKEAAPLDVEAWRAAKPSAAAPVEEASKAVPPPNPHGWVILPSGKVGNHESAVTAFAAMRRSGRFFLRGGRVCEIQKIDGADDLQMVTPAALCSAIETCGAPVAAWREIGEGKFALRPGARTPDKLANVWLESAARFALPTIKSVVTCPPLILYADTLVMLPPGYHEPSGTLVMGCVDVADISHREAIDSLDLLLRDFDFVTPSDRARALAMLITPALVAGGLLRDHVPIFGVEADKSQSGKGYLCELVQTVYGEMPSTVGRKEGGVGSFDESLAAALISGRPFIQIDNVRGRLASQFFEMVLTCARGATVGCRVPHRAEVHIDPSRVVFHVTSNGLEMTEDLANRACIVRIRKREKWNPPRFPEGGLTEHVAANRGRFLGAVYHLVARWAADGRQRTDDTRAPGRFRAWGQTLDWIVQQLAGCPPLLDGHEQVQTRVANPGLVWLREIGTRILAEYPDRLEPWSASSLVELSRDHGIAIPGTKDETPEDKAARVIGSIMARIFRASAEVQADDVLATREESAVDREDGNGMRIVKFYRFARFSPQPPQAPQCT